jgi:hypothetical protein
MLVALLATFAFGAVAAAAAQAEIMEAPSWTVEGHRLGLNSHGEPETRNITAKIYSANFKLEAGGTAITCTALSLEEGVILGSELGLPGKNDEVIQFTGCTTTLAGCEIPEGKILTLPVKSELVEDETGKSLVIEFFPNKGTKFTTITLKAKPGETCSKATDVVEGQVAGEVRADPIKSPELGKLIELGQTHEEAKSWLINFPSVPIKKVCLKSVATEKCKVVELETLTFNVLEAKLTGTALVLLSNEGSWSPLP